MVKEVLVSFESLFLFSLLRLDSSILLRRKEKRGKEVSFYPTDTCFILLCCFSFYGWHWLVINVLRVAQVQGFAVSKGSCVSFGRALGFSTMEFYLVLFYKSLYLLHLMHPQTHAVGIHHLADNPLGRNNSNQALLISGYLFALWKTHSLCLRRTMLSNSLLHCAGEIGKPYA